MENTRILVGAISGVGVKGVATVENVQGYIGQLPLQGFSFESAMCWFLAGLLGALGAAVFNYLLRKISQKYGKIKN